MKKEYTNGEMTIVWNRDLCTHSGNCVRGLGKVFRPRQRPWIKIDQADTSSLIDQVKKCPSGALTYYLNDRQDEQ